MYTSLDVQPRAVTFSLLYFYIFIFKSCAVYVLLTKPALQDITICYCYQCIHHVYVTYRKYNRLIVIFLFFFLSFFFFCCSSACHMKIQREFYFEISYGKHATKKRV